MPLFGKIVVIKRNGTDGTHFPLTATTCLFGRKTECDIRIQLPQVSKEHCKVEVKQNKEVIVTNLSTVNPTQLNGHPVQQPVHLKHGDVITIIDRSFRFEEALSNTTPKRSTGIAFETFQVSTNDQPSNKNEIRGVEDSKASKSARKSKGHISRITHQRRSLQISPYSRSTSREKKDVSPFSELYQMFKKKVDSKQKEDFKTPENKSKRSPKRVHEEDLLPAGNSLSPNISSRRSSRSQGNHGNESDMADLASESKDSDTAVDTPSAKVTDLSNSPSRNRRSLSKEKKDNVSADSVTQNKNVSKKGLKAKRLSTPVFSSMPETASPDSLTKNTQKSPSKRNSLSTFNVSEASNTNKNVVVSYEDFISMYNKEEKKRSPRKSLNAEQVLKELEDSPVPKAETPTRLSRSKQLILEQSGTKSPITSNKSPTRRQRASQKVEETLVKSPGLTENIQSSRNSTVNVTTADPSFSAKSKRASSRLKVAASPNASDLTVEKRSPKKRKSGELNAIPEPPSKRKRVSFGGHLSPELFDKRLPPNSPLKKGATPARLSLSFVSSPRAVIRKSFGLKHSVIKEISGKSGNSELTQTKRSPAKSPVSTPSKRSPAKSTPGKKSPVSISAKRSPAKSPSSPGKKSPVSTPAKRSPAKTPSSPGKKSPVSASAKRSPAKSPSSPGKKSPVSTPAKRSPAKTPSSPGKKSPVSASAKRSPAKSPSSPGKKSPVSTPVKRSPAKTTPGKKSPVSTPVKKSPAKTTPGKKSPVSTPVKRSPAKTTPGKKSPVSTPVKKSPAKTTPGKKSTVSTPVKRSPAKTTPVKKSPVSTPAKKSPDKTLYSPGKKSPVSTPVKRSPAKSSPGKKSPVSTPAKKSPAKSLATPGKKSPAKSLATPGKKSPAKSLATPGKKSPAKSLATPGKKSPAKSLATPGKKSPAKSLATPGKKSPAKSLATPGKKSPAKSLATPGKKSPVSTPAKKSPTRSTPGKKSPVSTPAKKSPAKSLATLGKKSPVSTPAKKSPAKSLATPGKKSPVSTPAKKSPAKSLATPGKKSPVSTPAKKSPAKSTPGKKSPVSTPAKKSPAKSLATPGKKSPVSTPAKKSPAKSLATPGKKSPVSTPAKKSPAKSTPGKKSPVSTPAKKSPAKSLATPGKKSRVSTTAKKSPAKSLATPGKKSPAKSLATPGKKSPVSTPAKKSPAKSLATPGKKSPVSTPAKKSPAKSLATPGKKSPVSTPAKKSPAKSLATPGKKSPVSTPAKKSPAKSLATPGKKSPVSNPAKKSPAKSLATPGKKSPVSTAAKKSPAKSLATPGKKSPVSTPAKKSPAKSLATPGKKSPAKSLATPGKKSPVSTPAKKSPAISLATPGKKSPVSTPAKKSPAKSLATPGKKSPVSPYTKGRFSVSQVRTPPSTDTPKRSTSQTPKRSRKSSAIKKTPLRRSRKLDTLEVVRSRRKSGTNLLVARTWADIVKFGVAKSQKKHLKKSDKHGLKVKTIKRKTKVRALQTPVRKISGQASTGHADSPATIRIGRAHTTSVNLTGHIPKVVRNHSVQLGKSHDESFTGVADLFNTPVSDKNRKSNRLAGVTRDSPVPQAVELSVIQTPEESGEMVISPLSTSSVTPHRKLYNQDAVSRLLRSPNSPGSRKESDSITHTSKIEVKKNTTGNKEKLNVKSKTSKEKRKTVGLTGVKRIMRTPKHKGKPITDPVALKKMLRTPKETESLPIIYNRRSSKVTDLVGVKRIMKTPKQKGEPVEDMTGIKRIMKTPRQKGEPVEDMVGIKRLMRTPKQKSEPVEDMVGIKRIMRTPKEKGQPVEEHMGINQLMSTPTENTHPIEEIFGIKQLIKTPPKKSTVEELVVVSSAENLGVSKSTRNSKSRRSKSAEELRVLTAVQGEVTEGLSQSPRSRSTTKLSQIKSPENGRGGLSVEMQESLTSDSGLYKRTPTRARGRPSKNSMSAADPIGSLQEPEVSSSNMSSPRRSETPKRVTPSRSETRLSIAALEAGLKQDLKSGLASSSERRSSGQKRTRSITLVSSSSAEDAMLEVSKRKSVQKSGMEASTEEQQTELEISTTEILISPRSKGRISRSLTRLPTAATAIEDKVEDSRTPLSPKNRGAPRLSQKKDVENRDKIEQDMDVHNLQESTVSDTTSTPRRGRPYKTKSSASDVKASDEPEVNTVAAVPQKADEVNLRLASSRSRNTVQSKKQSEDVHQSKSPNNLEAEKLPPAKRGRLGKSRVLPSNSCTEEQASMLVETLPEEPGDMSPVGKRATARRAGKNLKSLEGDKEFTKKQADGHMSGDVKNTQAKRTRGKQANLPPVPTSTSEEKNGPNSGDPTEVPAKELSKRPSAKRVAQASKEKSELLVSRRQTRKAVLVTSASETEASTSHIELVDKSPHAQATAMRRTGRKAQISPVKPKELNGSTSETEETGLERLPESKSAAGTSIEDSEEMARSPKTKAPTRSSRNRMQSIHETTTEVKRLRGRQTKKTETDTSDYTKQETSSEKSNDVVALPLTVTQPVKRGRHAKDSNAVTSSEITSDNGKSENSSPEITRQVVQESSVPIKKALRGKRNQNLEENTNVEPLENTDVAVVELKGKRSARGKATPQEVTVITETNQSEKIDVTAVKPKEKRAARGKRTMSPVDSPPAESIDVATVEQTARTRGKKAAAPVLDNTKLGSETEVKKSARGKRALQAKDDSPNTSVVQIPMEHNIENASTAKSVHWHPLVTTQGTSEESKQNATEVKITSRGTRSKKEKSEVDYTVPNKRSRRGRVDENTVLLQNGKLAKQSETNIAQSSVTNKTVEVSIDRKRGRKGTQPNANPEPVAMSYKDHEESDNQETVSTLKETAGSKRNPGKRNLKSTSQQSSSDVKLNESVDEKLSNQKRGRKVTTNLDVENGECTAVSNKRSRTANQKSDNETNDVLAVEIHNIEVKKDSDKVQIPAKSRRGIKRKPAEEMMNDILKDSHSVDLSKTETVISGRRGKNAKNTSVEKETEKSSSKTEAASSVTQRRGKGKVDAVKHENEMASEVKTRASTRTRK
ncbi:proliferation marker protein Ki-67 [Discoglossus pictus]